MTREEHIRWCKERAIMEMDYYKDPKQAYISMASDLRKHPDTATSSLSQLCVMQLMLNPNPTRQEAINFLDGFR